MKKLFLKLITFSLCMSFLTSGVSADMLGTSTKGNARPQYSGIQARGVWHRPNASGRETSLDGICAVLDEMAASGINMVFLETFYHGMTVFKTNLVPYYTGFEKYSYGEYPDYLTAFCAEAQKRGIEVHAWVESFYLGVNENTSLIKYFPDWLLINENGKINHTTEGANLGGYIFFDPANENARAYLVKFYEELLTKVPGISGLNLDYIRYPVSDFYAGTDTGYTKAAMSAFAEKYGLSLTEDTKTQDFKAQIRANSLVDEWTAYRAEQVTTFIGQVSQMVNQNHPECIISIAVHPDIGNAYSQKKQDFVTWVKSGYIDVVTPMVYYYNTSQISSSLKTMMAKFDGVYCYSGLYTTYHDQSTDELGAHIDASESCGADGFVLFESVKTFFNPSSDYAGFLSERYGADSKLTALPHWSTDRLIKASSDIILQQLIDNGADAETCKHFEQEMERIALIGEGTPQKLDATVKEIIELRDNQLANIIGESYAADAKATMDELLKYLEVRKSRLSFKGYAEDADQPSEDSDINDTESENESIEPPSSPDASPKSFWEILKSIIDKIINWFRDLFDIEKA